MNTIKWSTREDKVVDSKLLDTKKRDEPIDRHELDHVIDSQPVDKMKTIIRKAGTPDRDSNPDLPVIGSLVYCEWDALEHATPEAVYNNTVYVTHEVHMSRHLFLRTTHYANPCYANTRFADPLSSKPTYLLDMLTHTLDMLPHSLDLLTHTLVHSLITLLTPRLLRHLQDPRNILEEPVGLNNSPSRYSSSMYIPEKRAAGDSHVFSCSKDEVAIILLGSENTDNNLNYKNICLAYPLGAPNWNMIEHIEKGIKPSRVDADWFEALILGLDVLREQTMCEEVQWMLRVNRSVVSSMTYLAVVKGQCRLVHADHLRSLKIGTSELHNYVEELSDLQQAPFQEIIYQPATTPPASLQRTSQTQTYQIYQTLRNPLEERHQTSFQQTKPATQGSTKKEDSEPLLRWSTSVVRAPRRLDCGPDIITMDMVEGIICSFEDALPQLTFYQKKSVRPTPWNVIMDIGSTIKIPVSGYRMNDFTYCLIKISDGSSLPSWKKALIADQEARLVTEVSFFNDDENQSVVEKDNVIKAYHFGPTMIPFTGVDKEAMSYKSGTRAFNILGFTSLSNIPRHLLLGDGAYYFIAQKGNQHRFLLPIQVQRSLTYTSLSNESRHYPTVPYIYQTSEAMCTQGAEQRRGKGEQTLEHTRLSSTFFKSEESKSGLVSEMLLVLVRVCDFERSVARPRPGQLGHQGFLEDKLCSCGGLQIGETCFQEIVEFVESRVGLMFIRLPFSEDLRDFLFRSLKSDLEGITDDQIKSIDTLIDGMDLMVAGHNGEEAFESKNLLDPHYQHMLASLSHRSLFPDSPLPSPKSTLLELITPPFDLEDSLMVKLDHAICSAQVQLISTWSALPEVFSTEKPIKSQNQSSQISAYDNSCAVELTASRQLRWSLAGDRKFDLFEEDNEVKHTSLEDMFSKDVIEVGTITPEQDFLTLLKKGEPFSTVKSATDILWSMRNMAMEGHMGRQVKTECMFAVLTSWFDTSNTAVVVKGPSTVRMQDAIMKLVMHSFGTDEFIKAVAALKLLREKCKELLPNPFNQWLSNLKENLIERGKVVFWDMILKGTDSLPEFLLRQHKASLKVWRGSKEGLSLNSHSIHCPGLSFNTFVCDNIGLISVVENPGSTVTEEDAEIFLRNSLVKVTDSGQDLMDAENLKRLAYTGPFYSSHCRWVALSMVAVSSERGLILGSELAVVRGLLMWPDVLLLVRTQPGRQGEKEKERGRRKRHKSQGTPQEQQRSRLVTSIPSRSRPFQLLGDAARMCVRFAMLVSLPYLFQSKLICVAGLGYFMTRGLALETGEGST
uniref:(California timema) hypothetical protein n=1 Tax=Timema californicum TaxID=61474 RepID=A0A7R9P4P5_TIMCA|nr:unnamed protein product [Timema californicum]